MMHSTVYLAFAKLGEFFRQFQYEKATPELVDINKMYFDKFQSIINNIHIANPWFTPEFTKKAILSLGNALKEENLSIWLRKYNFSKEKPSKEIGVVTAGNIPLVGFHDMLCVLISGNKFIGKLSSKDNELLKLVIEIIISLDTSLAEKITLTEGNLKNIDAIIATGSDNSSRYFAHYFGKYPNIIRKNRNSIAIISGNETKEQLKKIADDIFLYFGLGCRNVSKLYLPKGYDLVPFIDEMEKYNYLINNNNYSNNYSYQRALLLMNQTPHLDNGFALFKEDSTLSSPIGIIHYEFYENEDTLEKKISFERDKIQCVVGAKPIATVDYGQSQNPALWDYADEIDTLEFLQQL